MGVLVVCLAGFSLRVGEADSSFPGVDSVIFACNWGSKLNLHVVYPDSSAPQVVDCRGLA